MMKQQEHVQQLYQPMRRSEKISSATSETDLNRPVSAINKQEKLL